jgi:hypothetical protein
MPIDQSRLDRLISLVDEFLKLRDQDELTVIGDGPPERIHGEGEKVDQEAASPWGAKPKVPVPIEQL